MGKEHQPKETDFQSNRILGVLISIEFFLMTFVPTTYAPIRIALLVPITIICLLRLPRIADKLTLSKNVLIVFVFVAANTLFVLYGLSQGNPGALRQATTEIIYPLIYLLIGLTFLSVDRMRLFIRLLFWCTFVTALYDLAYLIAVNLRFTEFANTYFFIIDTGMKNGFNNTFYDYSSFHTDCYAFSVPFLLALFPKLHEYLRNGSIPSKRLYFLAMAILLFVIFLSSSRALKVCLVVSFLLVGLSARSKRGLNRPEMLVVLFVALFALIFAFTHASVLLNYFSYQLDDFASGLNPDTDVRHSQGQMLIEGWLDSPLFGSGTGAVLNGLIRSVDQPWAFELSYHALLYTKGCIGFVLFFAIVAYSGISLFNCKDQSWITYPLLMGFAFFLICNSINPYLGRFSLLWIFYLPLLLLDCIEREEADRTLLLKCEEGPNAS